MEKYLSIPVTGAGNQLISCNGVISVTSSATGNVTLTYKSGTAIVLATTQADYSLRSQIQNEISLALATGWTNVSRVVSVVNTVTAVTIS